MSSIEEKFKKKLLYYNNLKENIEKKEKEYERLKNEREKKLKEKVSIKKLLEIDGKITEIQKKIDEMRKESKEDYLIKVSNIIKKYDEKTESEFMVNDTTGLGNFIQTRNVNNNGELYMKYMQDIENKPMKQLPNTNIHLFCTKCNAPWTILHNDAIYICQECGEQENYFETNSNGLTYEQEINTDININFAYKRSNHLREILAQLQAKETSNIPDEVIDALRSEFKKARIDNLCEITQEKVKVYLKKLKFNKYYENSRQITNILNGKPPPTITDELYEKLISMFMQIQEPFEQACPKNRKNFFSYNYILYKFCELLEEKEMMLLFPLLKSREKLYQQDCIWKKICEINAWPYYKSV